MAKITIKDKEDMKFAVISHEAIIRAINTIKAVDYPKFGQIKEADLNDGIITRYRKVQNQLQIVNGVQKLDFFDKVSCLIDALINNPAFCVSESLKPSKKLRDANAQYMVEFIMLFLESSEYRISGKRSYTFTSENFDLSGFDNRHKTELKNLLKYLLIELSASEINYNSIINLIKLIYQRGVIYKEEVDSDLVDKVLNNLIVLETYSYSFTRTELNEEYVQYKKVFRTLK